MRRLPIWIMTAFLGILMAAYTPQTKAQSGYATATYQDFYDGLAPYGQWIQDAQYGYVWLPNVGPDFRPYYTNGYWANTQYGNTWVSDYEWGWAPFHYGRWTYDNYYGWLWIPDTQWAPAWVSWRSTNDYYGWAPMGPGININVNLGLIPVDWWVFLSPNYFYDQSFYRYCNNDYRFRRNIYSRSSFMNYTYVDNRTTYYTGPRGDDYYRTTGRRASMYSINNNNSRVATRVNGSKITIYRPRMSNTANAVPSRVAQTDRAVTRRPQTFSGSAENAKGRTVVLQQGTNATPKNTINNTVQQNNNVRAVPSNVPIQQAQPQQNVKQVKMQQTQTPRESQVQQQQIQQRDAQVQQQRVQQQQMQQQQRDAQVQQQRVQQQQMQQQRVQQQVAPQRTQQIQRQELSREVQPQRANNETQPAQIQRSQSPQRMGGR